MPNRTRRSPATEKLNDYFAAGTRLVLYVDPERREVRVFTSPIVSRLVTEAELLDGGDVMPGFTLSLRDLYSELLSESNE